jgi:hypothetical protein
MYTSSSSSRICLALLNSSSSSFTGTLDREPALTGGGGDGWGRAAANTSGAPPDLTSATLDDDAPHPMLESATAVDVYIH